MRLLFLGDIFGKPGRNLVRNELPTLLNEFKADFCIANIENIAQGRGVTRKTASVLFEAGIDAFTSGNHLWDKRESLDYLQEEPRITKPLNYPKPAYGSEYYVIDKKNASLAILTLCGQVFLGPSDSIFSTFDNIYPKLKKITPNILIDIHAEATAEKRAFAYYCAGKVTAVIGTHTHIQTADEEILNNTAYITDAGMTGPHDSIIGIKKEIILEKMLSGMPKRYEVSYSGLQINGVIIEFNEQNGEASNITRIRRKYDDEFGKKIKS
ncbi:MAG: TIGR00282 family metallophosphoesterase [Candidatus Cloacimonadota bacterium]|nr:TIGR00282 family metallophosphoesterase [Candidatus Cloacimonadota bacterium]